MRGYETPEDVGRIPLAHLMWVTLDALKALGNSGSNQEINRKAIDLLDLSEEQQNLMHSRGRMTKIEYRLSWARSYLKAGGAIDNSSRGVWAVTDQGLTMPVSRMADIVAAVREDHVQRRLKKATTVSALVEDESEDEDSAGIVEEIAADIDWQTALLDTLQSMSPGSFEKLCQRILRESGFTSVEVTGRSGDGGIDGVGVLRIALLSFQVFFQCKRYRNSVGSSAIRDFRGAMVGRTDKGLFLTTGTFTAEAKKEAARDGAPVLDLIDGADLCNLLKELKLGVKTRMVEETIIDVEWFATL
ncbi:MAG: restriction endonuclease [Thermomicrobiales bacterium]|nr:restriction endonuclease [Thermomicrobiales bacterium]